MTGSESKQHSVFDLVSVWSMTGLLCLYASLVTFSHAATINKCLIDGKTVYTEEECPEDTAQHFAPPELIMTPSMKPDPNNMPAPDPLRHTYTSGKWYVDAAGYRKAVKKSRKTGTPIFIYVYTDWCGYCVKYEKNLLATSKVRKAMSGYIKVKINPEHNSESEALFASWGGSGYPSYYIQGADKDGPSRYRGPYTRGKDKEWVMMTPVQYASALDKALKKAR
jgi:thiol-disulfide isomerase/thioredoxin